MPRYPHIFFDLDHTLWDFERNSDEALAELHQLHRLEERGIADQHTFITRYKEINREMWKQYNQGKIDKHHLRVQRFVQTFTTLGVPEKEVPNNIWEQYLDICPEKTHLFPGTLETLSHLASQSTLYIITNGFFETQHRKIRNSGLEPYFRHMFISEEVGFQKPDVRIFEHALNKAEARVADAVMIGDTLEMDIQGAINAGMHQVYFNPKGEAHHFSPTYEIREIPELRQLL